LFLNGFGEEKYLLKKFFGHRIKLPQKKAAAEKWISNLKNISVASLFCGHIFFLIFG
jgi:hypothetical protein